jgi:hypothetical protein
MILKTMNAKMGKINNQNFKIRFHIWPIFCFRFHTYCIGIEDYDFQKQNCQKKNVILKTLDFRFGQRPFALCPPFPPFPLTYMREVFL